MLQRWQVEASFRRDPVWLERIAGDVTASIRSTPRLRSFAPRVTALLGDMRLGGEDAEERLRELLLSDKLVTLTTQFLERRAQRADGPTIFTGAISEASVAPTRPTRPPDWAADSPRIKPEARSIPRSATKPSANKRRPKKGAARKGAAKKRSAPSRSATATTKSAAPTYALLRCKPSVVVGEEFPLTVGLSPEAVPDVYGEPLDLPHDTYRLDIDVLAEGFTHADDESFTLALDVTRDDPHPSIDLHLTANSELAGETARIRVLFTVGGRTAGIADRFVAVTTRDARPKRPRQPPKSVVRTPPTPDLPVPDLVVHITQSPQRPDSYTFIIRSPHPGMPDPARFTVQLPDAKAWAASIYERFNRAQDSSNAYKTLLGIGRGITPKLHRPFWEALATVHRITKRPPAVLLVTEEAYVPWELAVMKRPFSDRIAPFLSAQCAIGRWTPSDEAFEPPEGPLRTDRFAVVWSDYEGTGGELKDVRRERDDLVRAYGAKKVKATPASVERNLGSPRRARIVHVAVHGIFDESGYEDGLLIDGTNLDPETVRGMDVKGSPLVFLNACQVGRERSALGRPAGFAPVLVERGAMAVVAPLWSVDDKVARELAVAFYKRAFDAKEVPAAEVLRLQRAAVTSRSPSAATTKLAYQFFGHPNLVLRWAGPTAGGEA